MIECLSVVFDFFLHAKGMDVTCGLWAVADSRQVPGGAVWKGMLAFDFAGLLCFLREL